MRKIIALPLMFCSFASFAGGGLSSSIQPYNEYIKTLLKASCEWTFKGGSEDEVVAQAIEGMKEGTSSIAEIRNKANFGAAAGQVFKNKARVGRAGKKVDNCNDFATLATEQEGEMTIFVRKASPSQSADDGLKDTTPDDGVYRTTAKDLAAMYEENEVAADDKIGGRKVEITGAVQDIGKDFANNVIIQLKNGNKFLPVRLSMEESERSKASKLKKGQEVTITCGKMMLLIGAPSGGNCTFD